MHMNRFRVREFVAALQATDDCISMVSALTQLDIETTACYSSLNDDRAPYAPSPSRFHTSLACDVLYHQCRAVSHLYLLLCNMRQTRAEHEFIQASTVIAVRHILSLTEAINHLLCITPPKQLGSIPPFVGYASFIAASLQLGSLVQLSNIHTQSHFTNEVHLLGSLRSAALSSLSALDRLRPLWTSVSTMVCPEFSRRMGG